MGSRDFSEGAAYGGAAFCRWIDAPHRRRWVPWSGCWRNLPAMHFEAAATGRFIDCSSVQGPLEAGTFGFDCQQGLCAMQCIATDSAHCLPRGPDLGRWLLWRTCWQSLLAMNGTVLTAPRVPTPGVAPWCLLYLVVRLLFNKQCTADSFTAAVGRLSSTGILLALPCLSSGGDQPAQTGLLNPSQPAADGYWRQNAMALVSHRRALAVQGSASPCHQSSPPSVRGQPMAGQRSAGGTTLLTGAGRCLGVGAGGACRRCTVKLRRQGASLTAHQCKGLSKLALLASTASRACVPWIV